MMTAMMLPSAVPVTLVYARIVGRPRPLRLTGFVAGYLAVWTVSALPATGFGAPELLDGDPRPRRGRRRPPPVR